MISNSATMSSNDATRANGTRRQEPKPIDGTHFLDHLRSAGNVNGHVDYFVDCSHDLTVGANNTTAAVQQHQGSTTLHDLFVPPLPEAASSKLLKPPIIQDRNVSWGHIKEHPVSLNNPSPVFPPPPRPINEPLEIPHHRRGVSSMSNSINNDSPNNKQLPRKQPLVGQLSVKEISPFEAEVETAILKALDERAVISTGRSRADTGDTSTLLPDFGSLSNNSHDDQDNEDQDDYNEVEINDKAKILHHQNRPLLSPHTTARRKAHHKRKESVEQTLFNLTEAMTALGGSKYESRHRHQPSLGNTDDFAMNVMNLYENHQPKQPPLKTCNIEAVGASISLVQHQEQHQDVNSVGSKISTQSHWSKNKKNLPTLTEENYENGRIESVERIDLEAAKTGSIIADSLNYSSQHEDEDLDSDNMDNAPQDKRKRYSNDDDRLFRDDWQKWSEIFRPHKKSLFKYIKTVTLYLLLPLLAIAAILFYFFDNVPTGKDIQEENALPKLSASVSYIMLFCVRQIITLSMSLMMQNIVIDLLALQTRLLIRSLGPVITLLIVQSKGWPHILFWWTIFDFAMLYGKGEFANHWAFYQDLIGLFNSQNPSGSITSNVIYWQCLAVGVSVSLVTAVKRFAVGLYLGRKQFSHFGEQLAKVLKKMLLVGEVASLAKNMVMNSGKDINKARIPAEVFSWNRSTGENDDSITINSHTAATVGECFIDLNNRDQLTGSLQYSEKLKLMQLLEQWEETEIHSHTSNETASISSVLRFRKALTFVQQRYPFAMDFGNAENRERTIESSQRVYHRLTTDSEGATLEFETIALVALEDDGTIDQQKAKDLIQVFRPDREGKLTMLDFVKSVDNVYKEFRLLQATIDNASRIDQSFENLFNVLFFVIVVTVILSQLGFNPLALFLSLSSVILAFAFMIGTASSRYFEGILFILVRRPYGIGDLISVGGVESPGGMHGALPWIVENVTLFETVVCFIPTNERASLSNGSLANSRIINWARSPFARLQIYLQFPLNTPYEKIVIFKIAIEEYMKARPREWRALNGFRANRVVANENYIEWLVVIQHREPWQRFGQVLDSQANLSSYCQEIARQLEMEYQAPRLPVELQYAGNSSQPPMGSTMTGSNHDTSTSGLDADVLTQEFQSIARNKHQIRGSRL